MIVSLNAGCMACTYTMNLLFSSEFAENGSIYDYIHQKQLEPTLTMSLLWARQVAKGAYQ